MTARRGPSNASRAGRHIPSRTGELGLGAFLMAGRLATHHLLAMTSPIFSGIHRHDDDQSSPRGRPTGPLSPIRGPAASPAANSSCREAGA